MVNIFLYATKNQGMKFWINQNSKKASKTYPFLNKLKKELA